MNYYQEWLRRCVRKLDGSELTAEELFALSDEDWQMITNAFNSYLTQEMLNEMYSGFVGLSRSALYGLMQQK